MSASLDEQVFFPWQLAEAIDFIRGLPPRTRVYVDEWQAGAWRFVFGDDPVHASKGLTRLKAGSRFRIRPQAALS
jgi:hypothetical protein